MDRRLFAMATRYAKRAMFASFLLII